MNDFVHKDSIVRRIWGSGDTILLIFAGASAEFALNKAVDWLYFTGRLPSDPLKRLFSTVAYARRIVFAQTADAHRAIDQITAIHKAVEQARGRSIPAWAYRDVLYMLIDYSIRAFELLERKLAPGEKDDVYDVFYRMGTRMQIPGLPATYALWLEDRATGLRQNLVCSAFTTDLYKQYRRHLGWFRFFVLKQAQTLLVPGRVNRLLKLGKSAFAPLMVEGYKLSRFAGLKSFLKNAILPAAYKQEVLELDQHPKGQAVKSKCPFTAAREMMGMKLKKAA